MLCAVVAFALVGLAVAHSTASAADCQYNPGEYQYCPPPPPAPLALSATIESSNYLEYLQLAVTVSGDQPSGILNFALYAPSDPTCSSPVYTSSLGLSGNGMYHNWQGSASGSNQANELGIWRWTAAYLGDSRNGPASLDCGTIIIDASRAATWLMPSYDGIAGLGDTASSSWWFSGALPREGTMTISLFRPGDDTCSTAAYTAQFDAHSDTGDFAVFSTDDPSSPPISETGSRTLDAAGVWHWTAAYSGDSTNKPSSIACGNAPVYVGTYPSYLYLPPVASPIVVGDTVDIQVDISSDAPAVGGTITLELYTDATCSLPAIYSTTIPVDGRGSYHHSWTADRGGDFRWVAKYSGDSMNIASNSLCADFSPIKVWRSNVTIIPDVAPSLVIERQPLVLGASVSDGFSPTGSVSFHLFEGSNCAGPEIVKTAAVTGVGHVSSPEFTELTPGTWSWGVSYSGDHANYEISLRCQPGTITVDPAPVPAPKLVGVAVPKLAHGGDTVYDRAQLSGGVSLAGTLTFKLFPNATCTGTPVASYSLRARRNGWYRSASPGFKIPPRTATATPKTWQWTVAYSGDANNAPVELACGSQPITIVRR